MQMDCFSIFVLAGWPQIHAQLFLGHLSGKRFHKIYVTVFSWEVRLWKTLKNQSYNDFKKNCRQNCGIFNSCDQEWEAVLLSSESPPSNSWFQMFWNAFRAFDHFCQTGCKRHHNAVPLYILIFEGVHFCCKVLFCLKKKSKINRCLANHPEEQKINLHTSETFSVI